MKPYNERLPMIDAAIDYYKGKLPREANPDSTLIVGAYGSYYFISEEYFNTYSGESEFVCYEEEFEQRAKELGYPKEQEMNNDWYEKGEFPPVGEVVEIYDCHSQLQSWNGKQVEVLRNIKSPDGERLSVVLLDGWVDATLISTKKLRPLRTETDTLVEQMERSFENAVCISTNDHRALAELLTGKGYRKVKLMSEDEFVDKVESIYGARDLLVATLYRAG